MEEVRRLTAADSLAEVVADYARRFREGSGGEILPALDGVEKAHAAGLLPGFGFFKEDRLHGVALYGRQDDAVRILFLHFLDGIASRDLGLLIFKTVEAVQRDEGVNRILSEFTYLGPADPHPFFARLGFRAFPRLMMRRELAEPPELAGAPAGFRFRPWRGEDREAVADLLLRGKEGTPDAELYAEFRSREGARLLLDTLTAGGLGRFDPELTWLAEGPEGPVGAALGVLLTPEDGFVVDLTVDPAYRRRGLGEGLLRWQLAALAEQGAKTALLGVTAANEVAIRLYRRLNFVETQRFTAELWLRHHQGAPNRSETPLSGEGGSC